MTKYCSLDFETTISDGVQGPTFRDLSNDLITQIWATHPNNVRVEHSETGFNRELHKDLAIAISECDVIIGHNLSYDLCYIWHTKEIKEFILRGGKIWDTQVAEYLLTGQQHTFSSLVELQLKYLGEKLKPSRVSQLYKAGVGADKIVKARLRCPRLWKQYNYYCKTDGSTPLRIFKAQYARAQALGMLSIIELYNDYLLSIINMQTTGIHIDVKQTEKTYTEFNLKALEYLEQAQEILKQYWDERLPPFNINSYVHKSIVLFGGTLKAEKKEKRQIGVYKNGNPRYESYDVLVEVGGMGVNRSLSSPAAKEGLYSTDEGVMKKIEANPPNELVRSYCQLQKQSMMHSKAATTYCKAFLDRNINGVLYPNFNNTTTVTSRLSSSEPNFQNIAKRNQFGKILHRLFIAPPGWKCVQIDFAQLEIWVLAWLSNDQVLIEDLLSGIDLHCVRLQYYNQDKTYAELYQLCKVQQDPYWSTERDKAKTLSYQKAYGAQAKKIAEETGLDIETVKLIMAKEDERYKGATALLEQVQQSINNTATISMAENIPSSKKGMNKDNSRIINGVEMLPIFDKNGDCTYTDKDVRQVGYWTSPTGKRYSFLDTGRYYREQLKRGFSFTQPKNYPMQGTGSDIQAISGAAILKALVSRSDVVKQVNEVHDSRWLYVREDAVDKVIPYLKKTIEDVPKQMLERFNLVVPFKFPVDVKIGDNFADLTDYVFK